MNLYSSFHSIQYTVWIAHFTLLLHINVCQWHKSEVMRPSYISRNNFMSSMGDLAYVQPPMFHMLYNYSSRLRHCTSTIDCMYRGHPLTAASYLLWSSPLGCSANSTAAFIDNNTSNALSYINDEFQTRNKQFGIRYEDVKYIIVTHAHLDHAGATGQLLKKCPNAVVLCHPRASRHLVDPTKLVSATSAIYGKDRFRELYGEVIPCEKSRVQEIGDGESVELSEGRELQFFHVDGHAKHHMVVLDKATESVFSGDAYGISYPWFTLFNVSEPFFYPSSSPPDFNASLQRDAIDKIISLKPRKIYLSHFGMVEDTIATSEQLKKHLTYFEAAQAKTALKFHGGFNENKALDFAISKLKEFFEKELGDLGLANADHGFWDFFNSDIALNAQGLVTAAQRMSLREAETVMEQFSSFEKCESASSSSPIIKSNITEEPGTSQREDAIKRSAPTDLCESFRLSGLGQYIQVLKKQEIDSEVFISLTKGDIATVFPSLPFGAKLRMERLQANLIKQKLSACPM